MKLIPLTQGLFAQVDDEDFDYLSQWKWCAHKEHGQIYAVRSGKRDANKKQKFYKMHIELMKKKRIDHVDGNGLNNQKKNLRSSSSSQNAANTKKPKTNNQGKNPTSAYKGVCWDKRKNKWRAAIKKDLKTTFLGYFELEIDAAHAYDTKAKELFGEFAKPNFDSQLVTFKNILT